MLKLLDGDAVKLLGGIRLPTPQGFVTPVTVLSESDKDNAVTDKDAATATPPKKKKKRLQRYKDSCYVVFLVLFFVAHLWSVFLLFG